MKTIFQKKIILFKIKDCNSNFYKLMFLNNSGKTNLIFYFFGIYSKLFFDVGVNLFGAIPYWFSKIVSYVSMREQFFFKVFCINHKFSKLCRNYSLVFNNLIKRGRQGYFLEFKIVGYFRAKRVTLFSKIKKNKEFNYFKKLIVMYLGYSHLIFIKISNAVIFVRGKKRFMFFTSYKQDFEKIVKQIFVYKPFNVYKIKGIRTALNIKKMKPGKQKQQKKVIKK